MGKHRKGMSHDLRSNPSFRNMLQLRDVKAELEAERLDFQNKTQAYRYSKICLAITSIVMAKHLKEKGIKKRETITKKVQAFMDEYMAYLEKFNETCPRDLRGLEYLEQRTNYLCGLAYEESGFDITDDAKELIATKEYIERKQKMIEEQRRV